MLAQSLFNMLQCSQKSPLIYAWSYIVKTSLFMETCGLESITVVRPLNSIPIGRSQVEQFREDSEFFVLIFFQAQNQVLISLSLSVLSASLLFLSRLFNANTLYNANSDLTRRPSHLVCY